MRVWRTSEPPVAGLRTDAEMPARLTSVERLPERVVRRREYAPRTCHRRFAKAPASYLALKPVISDAHAAAAKRPFMTVAWNPSARTTMMRRQPISRPHLTLLAACQTGIRRHSPSPERALGYKTRLTVFRKSIPKHGHHGKASSSGNWVRRTCALLAQPESLCSLTVDVHVELTRPRLVVFIEY